MHRPSWFDNDRVVFSFAPTVGINKDGEELFEIDPQTGQRTDRVHDRLADDVHAILGGRDSETIQWVARADVEESGIAVPVYYDRRTVVEYTAELEATWPDFTSISLGELIASRQLTVRSGHGSPSADVRTGTVPYIKVSDLRAGQVNINPTNRVSEVIARRYWGGESSGLLPFDLITPARTSKNIGDLAVLMPGQERVVLTKEVLVLRPGPEAGFDPFYLLWAMSLKVVRQQWQRIVFMQTNREDIGSRFREVQMPVAPTREESDRISKPFRDYYLGTAKLREAFLDYLATDERHHVFLSSIEAVEEEAEEAQAASPNGDVDADVEALEEATDVLDDEY